VFASKIRGTSTFLAGAAEYPPITTDSSPIAAASVAIDGSEIRIGATCHHSDGGGTLITYFREALHSLIVHRKRIRLASEKFPQ
jgi:hypothetical protein